MIFLGRKAQAETEIISILSIMTLLFLIIIIFNAIRGSEISFSREFYMKSAFCREVKSVIENAGALHGNQEIRFNAQNDFNIMGKTIAMNNYSCDFFGKAVDANILAGNVLAQESYGEVAFTNV